MAYAQVKSRSSKALWALVLLCPLTLLTACQEELYSGVSEREAAEMWAVLLRNGIDSDKVSDHNGTALHVEKSQIAVAVTILKECGLPRAKYQSVTDVFGEGLIPSPVEERVRREHAINQSLAETLSILEGVIAARVHVVLPEKTPFAGDMKPSSASVVIKHRPDANLENLKAEIKQIVAKSAEGLDYEHVNVMTTAARLSERCTGEGDGRDGSALYAQAGPIPKAALWLLAGALALFALGVVITTRARRASQGLVSVASDAEKRPVSRYER